MVYEWDFATEEAFRVWRTSWQWEQRDVQQGTASWTRQYGGCVRLDVEGAPGVVDFWTTLPIDLQFGDVVEVTFVVKEATEPKGGFSLIVGPARPHGHIQRLNVSVPEPGKYTVRQPIYQSRFVKGTPIGVQVRVWPGRLTLYLCEIRVVRSGW